MTTNDIDAIRNLADAATEGPWAIESYDVAYVEGYRVVDARVDYVAGNFDNEAGGVLRGEDAEFIAAARTLVPALCEEIEQLRAQLTDVRAKFQDALWTASQHAGDAKEALAELEKVRGQLTAANHRADGLTADHRTIGRGALIGYRDQNHRHNDRAPGWCICGDDWDDEGCTEYVGLTEAAQLFPAEVES